MDETKRVADQLKRAFYGKAWSGPSVTEALKGVTAKTAAERVLAGSHSIWELVHHITAWVDIARRRAMGENVKVTMDVNFPPIEAVSEAAWKASIQRMFAAEKSLRETILKNPKALESQKTYILFHGAVQHSLYHAGQIVLLKKAADQVDRT